MKTNVFKFNAGLMFAALTVFGSTLLVSCYEEGEINVSGSGAAKYFILGSVTDAATGAPITGLTVTVDDKAVDVKSDASTYHYELPAPLTQDVKECVVKVKSSGYVDATRTVLIARVGAGQISTGNGDFMLLEAENVNVDQSTKQESVEVSDQAKRDEIGKNVGVAKDEVLSYEGGKKDPFEVSVTSYSGVVIDPSQTEVTKGGQPLTRAFSASDYIGLAKTSLESELKQKVVDKFAVVTSTVNVTPVAGNTVYGVHLDYKWVIKAYTYTYTIEGQDSPVEVTLTAAYMENVTVRPVYNAHDVHSLQDAINGGQGGGGGTGGNVAI